MSEDEPRFTYTEISVTVPALMDEAFEKMARDERTVTIKWLWREITGRISLAFDALRYGYVEHDD